MTRLLRVTPPAAPPRPPVVTPLSLRRTDRALQSNQTKKYIDYLHADETTAARGQRARRSNAADNNVSCDSSCQRSDLKHEAAGCKSPRRCVI